MSTSCLVLEVTNVGGHPLYTSMQSFKIPSTPFSFIKQGVKDNSTNDVCHTNCQASIDNSPYNKSCDRRIAKFASEELTTTLQFQGPSNSLQQKPRELTVQSFGDFTCNICGREFLNWNGLKNDLLEHYKRAQMSSTKTAHETMNSMPKKWDCPPMGKENGSIQMGYNDGEDDYGILDSVMNTKSRKLSKPNPIPQIDLSSSSDGPFGSTEFLEKSIDFTNQQLEVSQRSQILNSSKTKLPSPIIEPTSVHHRPIGPPTSKIELTSSSSFELSVSISKKINKQRTTACRFCSRIFYLKTDLHDHYKNEHNDRRPYACTSCPRFFSTRRQLLFHNKYRHDGEPNSCLCAICGEMLPTRLKLKLHLMIHEDQKKDSHTLSEIEVLNNFGAFGDGTSDSSSLKKKKPSMPKFNYKEGLLDCHSADEEYCVETVNLDSWQIEVVPGSNVVNVSDSEPPAPIIEATSLQIIEQSSSKNTEVECPTSSRFRRLICRFCRRKFYFKNDLQDHYKKEHNNGRPYNCSICHKFFSTKNNLQVHNKHRHDVGPNPCLCVVCGKTLSSRTNLKIHMKIHKGVREYSCPICSQQFSRKANMQMHIVHYHSGEKKFSCKICEKSFSLISRLNRHQKLHTLKRNFLCTFCSVSFDTRKERLRHILLLHEDEKRFTCNICAKQFSRPFDLKVHMRYHNKDFQFTCTVCSKQFVQSGNYKRHMRKHTRERPYVCKFCSKTFSQVHHFKVHAATCLVEQTAVSSDRNSSQIKASIKKNSNNNTEITKNIPVKRRYTCPKNNLQHQRLQHKEGKQDSCNICDKRFVRVKNLKTHQLNVHNRMCSPSSEQKTNKCSRSSSERKFSRKKKSCTIKKGMKNLSVKRHYKCSVCVSTFNTKCELQLHRYLHKEDERFSCNICAKKFAQEKNLKIHMWHHNKEFQFTCTVCSKQFEEFNNYLKHIESHNGEKPYVCKFCQLSFSKAHQLSVHNRKCSSLQKTASSSEKNSSPKRKSCTIIKGMKNLSVKLNRISALSYSNVKRHYKCSVCISTFNTKCELRLHRLQHKEDERFSCSICAKKFAQANSLKIHLRLHNKEFQFSCAVCSKQFEEFSNYLKHIQSHNGDKPFFSTKNELSLSKADHYEERLGTCHTELDEGEASSSLISSTQKNIGMTEGAQVKTGTKILPSNVNHTATSSRPRRIRIPKFLLDL